MYALSRYDDNVMVLGVSDVTNFCGKALVVARLRMALTCGFSRAVDLYLHTAGTMPYRVKIAYLST